MWGKEFMYDSLLEWDKDLNIKPALAETWETPDDKTWIFRLRKGVKFHDGKELDSEDVKYSFEMQANPPPPGSIKTYYPKIASIDLPDKYTVKLNMSGPDPTVAGYLAWARYSPIVPVGHVRQGQPPDPGHRDRAVQAGRVRPERPRRLHPQRRTSGSRACRTWTS